MPSKLGSCDRNLSRAWNIQLHQRRSHLQPLGLTRKLPVKPQSWLSQLSTRSRRTVRQDSILRNSRQISQLRCMSLRPTSQISRALYDRSNSFLLVRYAAIKPNTHIPFGRQPALRATISVTISQLSLTRTLAQLSPTNIPISSSRSKLATARKPS